ncbi:MAG: hypothetical protein AAF802_14405 [Planctomycetota bacterium]
MRRVHSLESNRLSALVAEVVRIDGERTRLARKRVDLLRTRDQSFSESSLGRVDFLYQNNVWIDRIDQLLNAVGQEIAELLNVRQEAQERVMEQRAKVRGLEKLIDQLVVEIRAEEEAEQIRNADESALKNYSRN